MVAGIGRLVEGVGVRPTIPTGSRTSSVSVATQARHHAQPFGDNDVLAHRRRHRCAISRTVTRVIRAASSNRSHRVGRHRVAPGRRTSCQGCCCAVRAGPTDTWTRPDTRTRPPPRAMTAPRPARSHRGPRGPQTVPQPDPTAPPPRLSFAPDARRDLSWLLAKFAGIGSSWSRARTTYVVGVRPLHRGVLEVLGCSRVSPWSRPS